MKKGELIKALVKETEYNAKSVKEFLAGLEAVVTAALQKSGKVEIPNVVILKVVRTKATKATTKTVFGVTKRVAAKPASVKVKARVKKTLQATVKGAKSRGRR